MSTQSLSISKRPAVIGSNISARGNNFQIPIHGLLLNAEAINALMQSEDAHDRLFRIGADGTREACAAKVGAAVAMCGSVSMWRA